MFSKKYRPSKFNELIGQETNVVILKEILKRGSVLPLIFTGPFGSGKTSASRVFAKAVLCKDLTSDQEPCCKCQSCVDFEKDQNINYQEIDAASNGDVDSIRELREQVGYNAIGSRFKVTNIDESHNITKQGYNALLKILEEGVNHHIFIFCTNEPEKMLETVRSRCWRIHSVPVSPKQLSAHLLKVASDEGVHADAEALELISKVTAPHIRDALNVMEFLNFNKTIRLVDVESYFHLSENKDLLEIIEFLPSPARVWSVLDRVLTRMDASSVFDKILSLLLDLEAVRVKAKEASDFLFAGDVQRISGSGVDFLALSQLFLRVEKPVDSTYLKHLILEASRFVIGLPVATPRIAVSTPPLNLGVGQTSLEEGLSSHFDPSALFQAMSEPIESAPVEPESGKANFGSKGFHFDPKQEVPVKHESNIDLRNHDNYKLLRKRRDIGAEISKTKKHKIIDPMSEPVSFDAVERFFKDKNR